MIDFNPFEDIVLAAMGQDLTSGSNGQLSEMQFSVELGTAPHVALQIFDTSRGGGSGVQIAEIRWENIDDWLPGYVNKSNSDVMTALREMVRDNFVAVQKNRIIQQTDSSTQVSTLFSEIETDAANLGLAFDSSKLDPSKKLVNLDEDTQYLFLGSMFARNAGGTANFRTNHGHEL